MTIPQQKYIGGPFFLSPDRNGGTSFERYFGLADNHKYFASGRGAFAYILSQIDLEGRKVLMPDYCCWDSLGPILKSDYETYKINTDLTMDFSSVDPDNIGAVLLINYFGMVTYDPMELRQRFPEAVLVLDNVPALYELRDNGSKRAWADWQFYSFRKFLPVPDGALALAHSQSFEKEEGTDDPAYTGIWREAATLRHNFISGENRSPQTEHHYLELFEKAGRMIPQNPHPMSAMTAALLNQFPLGDYAERRRQNFLALQESLNNQALVRPYFTKLDDSQVPHFYPVRVVNKQRDSLKAAMAEQGIFCPVHWPAWKGEDGPDSLQFCATELSLPIDQRSSKDDIMRLAKMINTYAQVPQS